MTTSWDEDGIELLLKWCAGLETPPSLWLFGAELDITGEFVDTIDPMTSTRSGAIATYVTERIAEYGGLNVNGINAALGHDNFVTPHHLFVTDQIIFDKTGLSVTVPSYDNIYISSSIEFTR